MENFNPLDLSKKKILVTGSSSGIGRATAIYLSKLGARVVLVARNMERINDTISMMTGRDHFGIVYDFEREMISLEYLISQLKVKNFLG